MAHLLAIANWKMNGSKALVAEMAAALKALPEASRGRTVVCPPFPYLVALAAALDGSKIGVGGQNCHWEAKGAFTGEVAAAMLAEAGASYVILGHSERRRDFAEAGAVLKGKLKAAQAAGLTAILCIGETEAEYTAGRTEAVLEAQLGELDLGSFDAAKLILAYEPVWAIGTGRTPNEAEIAAAHAFIAKKAPACPILYGGSVTAENAPDLAKIPGVGGFLVGGASLKTDAFPAIVKACA